MRSKLFVPSALLVGAVLGVIGARLLGSSSAADEACKNKPTGATHIVDITDGKVSDSQVKAKLCDTFTVTNKDAVARNVAFGQHDKHIVYDGITEKVLNDGQSLTVTLDRAGEYHWHDHLHDEIEGYFTVTQ